MYQIDAHTLKNRLHNGEILNLLDVRQEIEYHTYNIGGNNIPLSKLSKNPDQINYNKTDEIIVVCKVGLRSKTAQSILINNGYQNVKNLKGGLIALQKLQR
ncbi:rhodanese-like domain-containing protein [Mucilaginibacter sp.]|uniref:rhodanese-like domain-containing protein n=1 Tax=Mucilaginibacter sp. TaxID=1882438 RepID=UPI00260267AB|nr:rhodanese-like domain-containing protein [Mucilaginibacter sp.]MDB5032410.1 rhodanese-like protein [Mucilaginibacter sp.]